MACDLKENLISLLPWVSDTQGNPVNIDNLKQSLTDQGFDLKDVSNLDLLNLAKQANEVLNLDDNSINLKLDEAIKNEETTITQKAITDQIEKKTIELSRQKISQMDLLSLFGNNKSINNYFKSKLKISLFRLSFIDVNSKTITLTDKDLNQKIQEFKDSKIRDLYDFLKKNNATNHAKKDSIYSDSGEVDIDYINNILDDAFNYFSKPETQLTGRLDTINHKIKTSLGNESDFFSAYENYLQMKYFDDLLSISGTSIVVSDPNYLNSEQNKDILKYRSETSNALISNWRTTENSDINLETSKISKDIIESIPYLDSEWKHDGYKYITFNEFNEVLKTILDPKISSKNEPLQKLFIDPVKYLSEFFNTIDFSTLPITKNQVNILNSIYNYVFNEEGNSLYSTITANQDKKISLNFFNDLIAQAFKTSPNNYIGYKYDFETKGYKTNSFSDNPSAIFSLILKANTNTHFKARYLNVLQSDIIGKFKLDGSNVVKDDGSEINFSELDFPMISDFVSGNAKSMSGYGYLKLMEKLTNIPFVSEPALYEGLLDLSYEKEEKLKEDLQSFFTGVVYDAFKSKEFLSSKDVIKSFKSSTKYSQNSNKKISKNKHTGLTEFNVFINEKGLQYPLAVNIINVIPEINRQNANSVYKNGDGDSVPAVGLPNLVKNLHNYINILKAKVERDSNKNNGESRSLLNGNVLFNNPELIKGVAIKSEFINKDGDVITKSKFRANEYFTSEVFIDYLHNILDETSDHIRFLPTVYSDKSNQMLVKISKDLEFNGKKIKDASASDIENEQYDKQQKYYRQLGLNIISDYSRIFESNKLKNNYELLDNTVENITHNIKVINNFLMSNEGDLVREISRDINLTDPDFKLTEETHFSKVSIKGRGNVLRVNPFIEHMLMIYSDSDKSHYNKYIQKSKSQLIDTIKSQNIKIDLNTFPELEGYKNNGAIKPFFTDTDYMLLVDNKGNLNPIIEKYFFLNNFLTTQMLQITVGEPYAHPSKLRIDAELDENGRINDEFLFRDHAARLIAQYKRMVIFQATMHPYTNGLYEGVKSDYNLAIMDDSEAPFMNPAGEKDKAIVGDGAGYVNPLTARLENRSLQSSSVGVNMKSIGHDLDINNGSASLLKWAVYSLENYRMRWDAQGYNLMRKMNNQVWNIPVDLTLDIFGRPRSLKDVYENDIYYFNPKRGYWKVLDISKGANPNEYIIKEVEVGVDGSVSGSEISKTVVIDNNFALYEALGGKYSMSFNSDSNSLVNSEASLDALAEYAIKTGVLRTEDIANKYGEETISPNLSNTELVDESDIFDDEGKLKVMLDQNIVYQPLKHSTIDYIVNTSAIKVGASNVNPYSTSDDDTKLSTMKMSSQFIGIQMDADHHADESEATESTQIISTLAANGHTTDLVNDTYNALAQVVELSLNSYLKSLNQIQILPDNPDSKTELYKELIKIVIDVISDTNSNISGYAGKAISEFKEAIKNKMSLSEITNKIPISSTAVFNKFISQLTSNINKNVIRRKYLGMAAVMIPSHNKMMYWSLNNITIPGLAPINGRFNRSEMDRIFYNLYSSNNDFKDHADSFGEDSDYSKILLSYEPIKSQVITEYTDPSEIQMFDTVQYTDDSNVVIDDVIDTYDKLRKYKKFAKPLFKDLSKPQNLKQQRIRFKLPISNMEGKYIDLYDIPLVRYGFENKLSSENQIKHKTYLNELFGFMQDGYYQLSNYEDVEFVRSIFSKETNISFIKILDRSTMKMRDITIKEFNDKKGLKKIGLNNILIQLTEKVEVKKDQCILPRIYQTRLGLKSGDSINDILNKGSEYFKKNLNEVYGRFHHSPNRKYVDVFVGSTNSGYTSIVYDNGNKSEYINTLQDIEVYTDVDSDTGIVYRTDYKGNRMYELTGISIKVDPDTKQEVVIVENNSDDVVDNNFKRILHDLDGGLNYYNFGDSSISSVLFDYIEENDSRLHELIKDSSDVQNAYDNNIEGDIAFKAEKMMRSFEETIENITANRIPAQHWQSIMGMEVVGFSDTENNEIYVAYSQLILQGSDYLQKLTVCKNY